MPESRMDLYVHEHLREREVTIAWRGRGWECEVTDATTGELIGWVPVPQTTYNGAIRVALDLAENPKESPA